MVVPPIQLSRRCTLVMVIEYRLFWFEPYRIKVFDEAEFGDGLWISIDVAADR